MRSITGLCRLLAAITLAVMGFNQACAQLTPHPPSITIDVAEPGQRVLGFGAQIWAGDMNAEPVLKDLGLRYVRMAVGPNWPNADALPPTDATRDEMDHFLAAHFDSDHEPRLANATDSWEMTDRLGIRVIMIQFAAPENWLSRDGKHRLLPEHLDDYARYWGSLVVFMDSHGMRPPYIELSNEPEGDWNTRILPEDYNRLVILTRAELNERGFHDVKIVGPGLAWLDHDDGGKRWIAALTTEGVDALAAWSTHAWDEKYQHDAPVPFMDRRWRDFKTAARRKDPAGLKPIFITEYATGATTFNGVSYDPVESEGNNRASDAEAYAQRVFEQTLQHVNQGASVLILWQAADQPWSHHAWGLVTSAEDGSRPRPTYHALMTLFPVVPPDAYALKPQQPDRYITGAGFLAEGQLVVALANGSNKSRTRTLVIRNAPGLALTDAARYHAGLTESVQLEHIDQRLVVSLPPESTLTCRFQICADSADEVENVDR